MHILRMRTLSESLQEIRLFKHLRRRNTSTRNKGRGLVGYERLWREHLRASRFSTTLLKNLRVAAIVALTQSAQARLGKTQVQKLVYFVQDAGVPLEYKYEIYHYG